MHAILYPDRRIGIPIFEQSNVDLGRVGLSEERGRGTNFMALQNPKRPTENTAMRPHSA